MTNPTPEQFLQDAIKRDPPEVFARRLERNFEVVAEILAPKVGWGLGEVASVATVTLPDNATAVEVTGTTTITSVSPSAPGRIVTLIFRDALTFTDGSNLALAGDFTTTADDTITLACNGPNWYEMARSSN